MRHEDNTTAIKNEKDQLLSEQQVAHNNCPRGDNACHRRVREAFAPKLAAMKNKETMENSRHRQHERKLGQAERDCKLWKRIDRPSGRQP